ncbi:MAG: hypothetical protein QOH86_1912, partial [Sphingomonadales bacterium]|nr:hypothetical protein [Sphingomonadales bacterium]
MKLVAYPLLGAAAFLLVVGKPPEERPISYKITPVTERDGSRALRVDMRFRGDSDGETQLVLPGTWAGTSELWRFDTKLEIRGAKSLGGTYDKPLIRHSPGKRLKVRYTIVTAYKE